MFKWIAGLCAPRPQETQRLIEEQTRLLASAMNGLAAQIQTEIGAKADRYLAARLQNERPIRESIIRLNERFDALGENQFVAERLGAIEGMIEVLMACRNNAQLPNERDIEDYFRMGLDRAGLRKPTEPDRI